MAQGSLTQGKDPTIVTGEGDDNVSAYRDRAYSVFEDWKLENYGNVIPQTFEALLEVDDMETTGTALDELLESAGVDASARDTSACTEPLLGIYTTSRTAPIDAISQIMIAHDLMMRDDGGILVFEPRATVDIVSVDQSKLVAHAPGEDAPRDVEHQPKVRRDLPSAVTVSYKDPEKDYEPGAETYVVQAAMSSDREEVIELNMVLGSAQAQEIARRIAWSSWAAAHSFDGLQLPPSMLGQVKPGTVMQFDADGRTWDMLTRSVLVGVNEVIRVAGEEEQRQTLTHSTLAAAPGGN